MAWIRVIHFKVQDMFNQVDLALLESYVLPKDYQEMQRRLLKERIQQSGGGLKSESQGKIVKAGEFEWVISKEAE